MVLLSTAHTRPLNPPSASPILNADQVWAGLLLKCRRPQEFVAPIVACEVLSETEKEIVRMVEFDPSKGPMSGKVKETIDLVRGRRADFHQPKGLISNIVSSGETPTELYLTFTFDMEEADIEPGSKEEKEKIAEYDASGIKAVDHSIKVIREMVVKGEI
ncbi:hypothetical protein MMC09_001920 [Bachmanniomyces sp. S44760]|nr:hypothetical protein [Bachmanniomyces sp. S44760]